MKPVQEWNPVLFVVPFVLLVLAFLCASVRPPMRWPTLLGRPNRPLRVFFLITMASSSVVNSLLSELSINVDGLRDSLKRTVLLQWLLARSVDVVCLQEGHCVSESVSVLVPVFRIFVLCIPWFQYMLRVHCLVSSVSLSCNFLVRC